jgi:glycerol-3-phosphate dehydrogenase
VWGERGLVSVSGGKLTTFRLIALDTLRAAQPWLPAARPVPGEQILAPVRVAASDLPGIPTARARRLLGRYGDHAVTMVNNSTPEQQALIGNTQFALMELRWALEQEAVQHLDDLLLRRTRLGSLLPNGAQALLSSLKPLCQQALQWDDARWEHEVERYQSLWQRHYSLPSTASKAQPSPPPRARGQAQ